MSTAPDWTNPEHRPILMQRVPKPKPGEPRRCFYVGADSYAPVADAYIASLVTEHDAGGHAPLVGIDPPRSTWYWGAGGDLDAALAICEAANREHFGLSPEEAEEIVDSSVAASLREQGREEAGAALLEVATHGREPHL